MHDDKRKKISIGDLVIFINAENKKDTLSVKVVDLFVFDSFDELYKELSLLDCGYTKEDMDIASPKDMEKYYSKERQNQYGVIGIKISLN